MVSEISPLKVCSFNKLLLPKKWNVETDNLGPILQELSSQFIYFLIHSKTTIFFSVRHSSETACESVYDAVSLGNQINSFVLDNIIGSFWP
jgi:hypothetical protein